MKTGLTFDDVLLVPKKSKVVSRKNVSVSTKYIQFVYVTKLY